MSARTWKRALALGLVCACSNELPPAGQIVLYVDTDAIVRELGAVSPDRLAPLVDRARLEVLRDGKPLPNSTRDVPIDARMLREKRLSFGILPPPSTPGLAARVRLFRADRVFGPDPPPGVTLDTTVTLPPVSEDGVVELSVLLEADDFGVAIGPVPATPGPPASSLVGSWRGGLRQPCAEPAGPDEACIPGSSFFFGNEQLRGRSPVDIVDERLVVVSPFYLDKTEVTVAAFRAQWGALAGRVAEPVKRVDDGYCTWTAAPEGDNERRPINCLSWPTAKAFCESLGKALPTEAQFEFVASGLGRETAFPWGDDEPACSGAVWGCGGIATAERESIRRGADNCRQTRVGPGPFPPGQGLIDRVTVGGVEILDLGGNVAEWSLDAWARPTDPAWSSVRPQVDPLNTTPNDADGDLHPVRGGDWASTLLVGRVGIRRFVPASTTPLVGLRCARAARPR